MKSMNTTLTLSKFSCPFEGKELPTVIWMKKLEIAAQKQKVQDDLEVINVRTASARNQLRRMKKQRFSHELNQIRKR